MKRGCGILLHITSLPEPQGAGSFSHDCFRFIDFLASSGVKYWQILPLGPTDKYGSPYSSVSLFAGNIEFINKGGALNEFYKKNTDQVKLKKFRTENKYWVESYADFMVQRDGGKKEFYIFSQMMFFEAWAQVKAYANQCGISIIGDLPFYTAPDSADVWADKTLFDPSGVAGVPPDYFNKDGQLWGNPLYDFRRMARDKYKWWINRIKHSLKMFDIVRIDHFRAFESYYKIPFGQPATKGSWQKGPGGRFFNALKNAVPDAQIILEDLGVITEEVRTLANKTGFPGMSVLQFGFDGDKNNPHLPVNYSQNCVAYVGTHDNDTFIGFLKTASRETRKNINECLSTHNLNEKDTTRIAIESVLESKSEIVVLCMQDLLFQDSKSRMNKPGTTDGNWKYKIKASDLSRSLTDYLRMLIERSGRL